MEFLDHSLLIRFWLVASCFEHAVVRGVDA